jgi:toxin YoeB
VRVLWASRADPFEVRTINDLIENIRRDAFKSIGQPEPLKAVLQGWWFRQISREHRLVYRVEGKDDLSN